MAWSGSTDLDGGHAEGAGRLEVHAEVVEEDGLGRLDAEQLAGDLVEPRVGLADADPARLDDRVEQAEHLGEGPSRRVHAIAVAR